MIPTTLLYKMRTVLYVKPTILEPATADKTHAMLKNQPIRKIEQGIIVIKGHFFFLTFRLIDRKY